MRKYRAFAKCQHIKDHR